MINWVLAATFICGASVFTSCTNDSSDNPSQEQAKKDRKEFIQHTRESLKEIAENLNFSSWEIANRINQEFNTAVLNNSEFEKAIIPLFIQKIQEGIQPVEEGSELAEMGYKQVATIDMTFNPQTQEKKIGGRKLTLKAGGDTFKRIARRLGNEETAVVILIPSEFTFSIAGKVNDSWHEGLIGVFKNNVTMSGESEFLNLKNDGLNVTGILTTTVGEMPGSHSADATELYFDIANDPVANESSMKFSFGHNDKSMIELEATGKYTDKDIDLTDFSQFTTSGRILDVLVALMSGGSLEGTLTLNDDLTTTLSVNDLGKAMLLQKEMARARRSYADQATIEGYTQQLNELVNAQITCKGVNQVIPMKLQTVKFGVDYWAMPAFNFADEQGYVPFTQLLDKESVEYAINIVDHAAEPMAGAIVTVRQLMQFVQTFLMQMRVSQAQAQAANE